LVTAFRRRNEVNLESPPSSAKDQNMLFVLDKTFFALHTLLMGFNMVGWAWQRTRLCHLTTLLLTAASWFVLGAFYGWGYCICMDWHAQVRRQLGYHDTATSYLQLLVAETLGISLDRTLSDWITGGVFGFIVIVTIVTWMRVWRQRCESQSKRKAPTGDPLGA
jgi:hypothetical protein